MQDADCDDAVAPHVCSRLRALLDDDAHDWGRVLGEPDRPHPKIRAREGVTGLVNRKLAQIGHERLRGPGGADRTEQVEDPLDERTQWAFESIDQRIGVRGRPPRFREINLPEL